MRNRPFSPLWISPESAKYTSGISIPDAMARDGLDLAEIFDQIKIGPLSRGMGFGTWASLSVLGVSFGTLRRLLQPDSYRDVPHQLLLANSAICREVISV